MNLGLGNTLLPGDPRLNDHIVGEVKSQGIFDQFRKECIADVDTKPAYQNLRTRVESSVNSFLSKQRWRADLNKNQLRETLRKHISDGPYLDTGVERIVDQVVNPKIYSVFMPQVEDVVYDFMGLEKPKREKNGNCGLKDLLPKDLDPVSPESDKNSLKDISLDSVDANLTVPGEEDDFPMKVESDRAEVKIEVKTEEISQGEMEYSNGATEEKPEKPKECFESTFCELEAHTPPPPGLNDSMQSEDKDEDEEESPVFEPIDIMNLNESNVSNDSHLSGISELTSHRSRSPDFSNDFSRDFDFSNQDSQLSKVSSDSRLSIVTDFGSSNQPTTPVLELPKDESSKDQFAGNFKAIQDEGSQGKDKMVDTKQRESLLELKDGSDTRSSRTNLSSKESSRDGTESVKDKADKREKRESGKSRHSKERPDSRESRSRKDKDRDKPRSNESKSRSSDKSKVQDRCENSRDSTDRSKESKDSRENKETPTKVREEKPKESPSKEGKDLKDIYKEKIRELREKKELTEKEKLGKDGKESRESSRDGRSGKDSKEKRDSSRDQDKHRSSSSRTHSSSRHESRSKSSKEESKSSRGDSRDKKRDESHRSKETKLRSQSESNDKSDKDKKSSKVEKDEKEVKDSKSASKANRKESKTDSKADKTEKRDDSKDRKRKEEKKSKAKDDHSSLRKGANDRRSSDRDGSSGSSGRGSQKSSSSPSASASKPSSASLSKDSNTNSSSETSDGVDETQEDSKLSASEKSAIDQTDVKLESLEIKAEPADIEVETADIEVETAGIKVKTADIRVETGDIEVETADIKVEKSEIEEEKSAVESENREIDEPAEIANPKRLDPGQSERSLPLKKRTIQSQDVPSCSTELPTKKPKIAKNVGDAKKSTKIRKKVGKDKLRSQSSMESPSPVSELSEELLSEAESETLPSVPDEERVQIIEVKAEEEDQPYPGTEFNLTLDESSRIILPGDSTLFTELAEKKSKSSLSEMESAIRESLTEMISDQSHENNTGKLIEASSDSEEKPSTSWGGTSSDATMKDSPAIIESEPVPEPKEEALKKEVGLNQEKEHTWVSDESVSKKSETSLEEEKGEGKLVTPSEKTKKKKKKLRNANKEGREEKDEEQAQKRLKVSKRPHTPLRPSVENPQSSDEEDCRYFLPDNEILNRFTQFLNSLEAGTAEAGRTGEAGLLAGAGPAGEADPAAEVGPADLGLRPDSPKEPKPAPEEQEPPAEATAPEEPELVESKPMAPPQSKRKSSSPLSDILLNNSNNNNDGPKLEAAIFPEEGQSAAKKKKLGRPRKQSINLTSPSPQIMNENFVLPMSPESDVSATSEKNSGSIKEDRNRPRGSNQRYTSDDLYKPRPLFASSSRRSRRSNT